MSFFDAKTIICGAVVFIGLFWWSRRPRNLPPGPWGVPLLGYLPWIAMSRKEMYEILTELSHTYGTIFSLKLGAISVVALTDYDSLKEGLSDPKLQQRPLLDLHRVFPGKGIISSVGKVWQEQRKFSFNLFRKFGVGKAVYEEVVVGETKHLINAIKLLEGNSADIRRLLGNAVCNVISSVAYGRRFEYHDKDFKEFYDSFEKLISEFKNIGVISAIPFLNLLPMDLFFSANVVKKLFNEFFIKPLNKHKTDLNVDKPRDFIDAYLIQIKNTKGTDTEEAFSEENLIWTISDIFGAGLETTTDTLKWSILYLLREPDIQENLQKEIDCVVGRDRKTCLSDQENLPQMEAFTSEVLRIGTTALTTLAHMAEEDTILRGYSIPKGTVILPNLHSVMMDEKLWGDPHVFRPSRFLDEHGKVKKPEQFIAFGIGRRHCIGEQLARMELFIILTHLLQTFTFHIPLGEDPPTSKGYGTFHTPVHFKVCVKERR